MLCALIILLSVSHVTYVVTDINSWTSTARQLSLHLFLL